MQDPEFEKNIQQKMEELHFTPPDSVWNKVAVEIEKDKKRRRPLFWIFFFAGIALVGGFYAVMNHGTSPASVTAVSAKNSRVDDTVVSRTHDTNTPPSSNIRSEKKASAENKVEKNNTTGSTGLEKENLDVPGATGKPSKKTNKAASSGFGFNEDNTVASIIPGQDKNHRHKRGSNIAATKTISADKDKNPAAGIGNGNDQPKEKFPEQEKMTNAHEETTKPATVEANNEAASNPVTKQAAAQEKTELKTASSPGNNTNPKNKKEKTADNKSWQLGFTGSAGISSINKTLFRGLNSVADVYAFYAPSTGSGGPTYPSSRPSSLQSGFSFDLGAFVQKPLSRRWTFSAGLNYHYYSTHINVGGKVDSMPLTIAVLSSRASDFYNAGASKSYTNQYHFIELPVYVQWQLNNSRQVPVALVGGLTVSQMLSSNALHYNSGNGGIYYKDNNLFHKTQLGGNLGLLIGFHINHVFIQAGPQVQYNFSNFLKDETSPEHLFFTGIRFNVIPGKK